MAESVESHLFAAVKSTAVKTIPRFTRGCRGQGFRGKGESEKAIEKAKKMRWKFTGVRFHLREALGGIREISSQQEFFLYFATSGVAQLAKQSGDRFALYDGPEDVLDLRAVALENVQVVFTCACGGTVTFRSSTDHKTTGTSFCDTRDGLLANLEKIWPTWPEAPLALPAGVHKVSCCNIEF